MAIDLISAITVFFILATIALICATAESSLTRHRRSRSSPLQDPKKMADAKIHLHTRL
jgi:hypothetical protein